MICTFDCMWDLEPFHLFHHVRMKLNSYRVTRWQHTFKVLLIAAVLGLDVSINDLSVKTHRIIYFYCEVQWNRGVDGNRGLIFHVFGVMEISYC